MFEWTFARRARGRQRDAQDRIADRRQAPHTRARSRPTT
jgi:hypothetical protein